MEFDYTHGHVNITGKQKSTSGKPAVCMYVYMSEVILIRLFVSAQIMFA